MFTRSSCLKHLSFLLPFCCLLLAGCSKSSTDQQGTTQQYFETNFLDRNYTVHLATDNGSDLTAQYNGYVFRLIKGTALDGLMTATKNTTVYNGTWSTNTDYSKLTINLPTSVPEFIFLVREWKFTRQGIPILELAPWVGTDPKVLHLERL